MAFKTYRKHKTGLHTEDPTVSVHASGGIHLSAAMVAQWFDDVEKVGVLFDRDLGLIALDRDSDEPAEEQFAVSTYVESGGAQVSVKGALEAIGVDVDELSDLSMRERRVTPELDDETGYILIDLSHLVDLKIEDVDDEDEEVTEESDDEDDVDEFWCGICGAGPMSEQGVKIHHGQKHEGEPLIEDSEPILESAEDPDGDDVHDPDPDDVDDDEVGDVDADEEDFEIDPDQLLEELEATAEEIAEGIEESDVDAQPEQHNGELELSRYGLNGSPPEPDDLVDALDGAQTVHMVQRDLGLGRRETEDLLERLDLLRILRDGSRKLERDECRKIVSRRVAQ